MDKVRFKEICEAANLRKETNKIGTLSEKRLHAVLKRYFEPNLENQEIKFDKYIADIKNESGIIEIQTQNFNKLRDKLNSFLPLSKVLIVYPIAQLKWLNWINPETGEITNRRKSPKTGSIYDAFFELYKIKWMLNNNNLSFCFLLLEMEEYRNLNGWSKDHKKGSTRFERFPIELIDEIYIKGINDYKLFLPNDLPIPFTTKDYANLTKLTNHRSQEAINVLHHIGIIKRIGKKGKAFLYEVI